MRIVLVIIYLLSAFNLYSKSKLEAEIVGKSIDSAILFYYDYSMLKDVSSTEGDELFFSSKVEKLSLASNARKLDEVDLGKLRTLSDIIRTDIYSSDSQGCIFSPNIGVFFYRKGKIKTIIRVSTECLQLSYHRRSFFNLFKKKHFLDLIGVNTKGLFDDMCLKYSFPNCK